MTNTKRVADMTPEEVEIYRAKRNAHAREYRGSKKGREARERYSAKHSEAIRANRREWKQKNPEKVAAQKKRWKKNNMDAFRASQRRYWKRVREKARMNCATSISQLEIYRLAEAAVPRWLVDRDYVVSDIVMAVLERQLTTAEIAKRAPEFIRAHNRANDHYKTVSLNECLPGTDLARIDSVTADDLPWATANSRG